MTTIRSQFLVGRARSLILAFFFISETSALTYEILWTRQLILVAGAPTPAVSLVLAVFMGGLALGSWMFGLVQPHILYSLTPIYLRFVSGPASRGPLILVLRLVLAVLLLLIPTTLMGGTLSILLRYVSRSQDHVGQDLGHLYAANLAGATSGAAFAGFMLIRTLGLRGTLWWAVGLNAGIAVLALTMSFSREAQATRPAENESQPGREFQSPTSIQRALFPSSEPSCGVRWRLQAS